MAKQTIVRLVDDMDDKPIEDGDGRTVAFSFDGTDYEIDLRTANVAKFEQAVAKYIANATKVRKGRKAAAKGGDNPADIRAWAKDNGYKVPDRGRIPADIRDAYNAK